MSTTDMMKYWRYANPKARDRFVKRQREASQLVNVAVKKGILYKPGICSECHQRAKIQGHHEDYDMPYHVEWLCPKCHSRRPCVCFERIPL